MKKLYVIKKALVQLTQLYLQFLNNRRNIRHAQFNITKLIKTPIRSLFRESGASYLYIWGVVCAISNLDADGRNISNTADFMTQELLYELIKIQVEYSIRTFSKSNSPLILNTVS